MRTIQLSTTQINNKKSLDEALAGLMDYPSWYGDNLPAWLDLVTVGQRPEPTLIRFRTAKEEMFIIEVQESLDFFERKRNLFKEMMQVVAAVNALSVSKIGYPVLTLNLQ